MIQAQQPSSIEEWYQQCMNGSSNDDRNNSCRIPNTLEEYIDIFGCHSIDDEYDDTGVNNCQQGNSLEEWYQQDMNRRNDQANNCCRTPQTLEEYMEIFGRHDMDEEDDNYGECLDIFNDDAVSETDNNVEWIETFHEEPAQKKEVHLDEDKNVVEKGDSLNGENEQYLPDSYFKWYVWRYVLVLPILE